MKIFFLKFSLLCLPALFFFIFSFFLFKNTDYDNFGFLKFQIDKLKKNEGKKFSKIYIGDSSGGYSINTSCDSSNSLNLCLTGSFGYAGQISFLEVINSYIDYDTIIVAHSIGVASRDYSEFSYYAPNIHSKNIIKNIQATFFSLKEFENVFFYEFNKYFKSRNVTENYINSDYRVTLRRTHLNQNLIKPIFQDKQVEAFKELDIALIKNDIPYYLIFTTSLPYSEKYFKELKIKLKGSGIHHLFNRPFLLNYNTKGDAEEHINPVFNCLSTKYYVNVLNGKY